MSLKRKAAKETIEGIGNAGDKLFTSKEERLEKVNQDRANARNMQNAANMQNDKFSKRAVYYLAFFWSFIASLYVFAVSFIQIPDGNQRIVDTITGFLMGTIIAAIINFFFGSSDGSKTKSSQVTGLIERMFNKNDNETWQ